MEGGPLLWSGCRRLPNPERVNGSLPRGRPSIKGGSGHVFRLSKGTSRLVSHPYNSERWWIEFSLGPNAVTRRHLR